MKCGLIIFLLSIMLSFGMGKKMELIEPRELYESFSSEEKDILETMGYFARKSHHKKFSDLYESLKDRSLPIYVTTDCVLHTYHVLYDYSLRILEMNYLYPEINSLTQLMIKNTKELLKDSKGDIKEALLSNLVYFEVAAKLLDPDFTVSKSVEKKVNEEINLIEKAQGFNQSPIFDYEEDYSQYKPRGHYTRTEILKRYFKAMMWYGRMSFRLMPEPGDEDNKKGKYQTRQALLILESAKNYFKDWERINSPIILYVGKSDDLTLLEYFDIKNKIFPEEKPIEIATHDEKLIKFIEKAMEYRPPKIVSGLVWDIDKPEVITKGLRFFGQKFIPDSYIFQNLVYDKVGTRTEPRLFPRGLDVFAVFGSDRAKTILLEQYNEGAFKNYELQLERLTNEFKEIEEKDWYFNLYWGWLYTLKSLLLPIPKFQPAYNDKCLHTALGSWAELRHDTILYAKQSYTAGATSMPPQPELAKGYVEPIPDCYKRLKKLVDLSKTELEKKAFLDKNVKSKFDRFSDLLGKLQSIAETEVKGEKLAEDDYHFIQHIGGYLETLETFHAAGYENETDESTSLIADVHTDPNTKMVLEVGNDIPATLYVIVDIADKKQLFIGGIYDYYEFLQPMGERLTDEEWQKLEAKPEKQKWIGFFVK